MENQVDQYTKLRTTVEQLHRQTKWMVMLFICVAIGIICLLFVPFPILFDKMSNKKAEQDTISIKNVSDFKLQPYPSGEEGELAAFGEKLIKETSKYLGPSSGNEIIYSGNNLSCSNCHLNGGTKPYAAPYIGLTAVFPMFSGREGRVASLEDRINGCFQRSMAGKALPVDSREMLAIVSYMKHLSKDVKIGGRIEGQGFVKLNVPDRKADLINGEVVFKSKCISCHQENGLGLPKNSRSIADGYTYPPLWGDDSFNDGAGMARLLTAAKFIKGNMPLGASIDNPLLSDDEAYDVAAYINSFDRPIKIGKERDYPDLKKKPKDTAYPPFADNIKMEQHKYGPFNF